jgi:hypothetical protein
MPEYQNRLNMMETDRMTYEELLALEDRMGSVSKGLGAGAIAKIPSVPWWPGRTKNLECSICKFEFEEAN